MTDKTGTLRPSVLKVALALGTVYLIWGSTYLAIRFAIETIPPFPMAACRYLTAGAMLYGWARWRGAPRPSLLHWRSAVVVGAFLLLGGNGGVVWAEQRVDSGLAALLISTEPLWIVLLFWLRSGRQRLDPRVMAGLLLGFTGVMLLVRPGSSGSVDLLGAAALVLASLCWAWASLYGQRAPLPASPLASTGIQDAQRRRPAADRVHPDRRAGPLRPGRGLPAVAAGRGLPGGVRRHRRLHLLRLVAAGGAAGAVSTYAYVNPVVAVFLGWAFAGEPLTKGTLVAVAVILGGVVLITTSQGKTKKKGGAGAGLRGDRGLGVRIAVGRFRGAGLVRADARPGQALPSIMKRRLARTRPRTSRI